MPRGALFCILASLAAGTPGMPEEYSAVLLVKMPYIGLEMPLKVFTSSHSQRIEYYDGLEVDTTDSNGTFKFNFQNGVQQCRFTPASPGPEGLLEGMSAGDAWKPMQLLPDLSQYTRAADELIGGTMCQTFSLNTPRGTTGTMNDNITFYWDPALGKPVRWRQHSRPVAFSSHTDDYVFDYVSFERGAPRKDELAPPTQCRDNAVVRPDLSVGLQGLLASVSGVSAFPIVDLATVDSDTLFGTFLAQSGKSYAPVERALRRSIFLGNVQTVRDLNKRHAGKVVFKGNRFLDMTTEEVLRFRGGKSAATRVQRRSVDERYAAHIGLHEKAGARRPRSFDWRATQGVVGRVKDQGFCGSCWTFGALGPIESMHAIQTGRPAELPEQFVIDCVWTNGTGESGGNFGCDGGDADIGVLELITKYGGVVPTAKTYGTYQSINGYCKDIRGMEVGAKVTSWVDIKERDEDALLDALATKGPLSVNIMVPDELLYYDSGVINTPSCKNNKTAIDHSVVLVGYGTDEHGIDYYTIRNSWSTYWGEEGYVRIARGENDCAIASDAGYAVLDTATSMRSTGNVAAVVV